ncbi:ThiF family adenylyltransferase [Phycicoccus sp. KQZ13P-1]|uniref:ThiF family adenylyltransferase n=1 Tax=Phycicoccus mangrovi TaxID=2840470 RepID=UPI001C0016A7|nr:ThiF family adenylyltransferase [Phycicoccus mangrovi]MBT9255301.1 ThiF family adenylyltransferase [Phycicoccus mangrovi]
MNPPTKGWSVTIPAPLWQDLHRHLFTGGGGGAVLLARRVDGPRGPRLLVTKLIAAVAGTDYVEGTFGHHALSATFVRDAALQARTTSQAYIAVHAHAGVGSVEFSGIDLASHERGYPALRQITGQIVGALVLAEGAAAGDLWLPDGSRTNVVEVVVPGNNLLRLRPTPARLTSADIAADRQVRLFGDAGQAAFTAMRVAVVGLGGAGSLLVEHLARLGVGHLVLIDDDQVENDNLNRLTGATPSDVGRPKTQAAADNARRANPNITLDLHEATLGPNTATLLTPCDWIFLAADTAGARHYANKVVEENLIPGTQVGVKIQVCDDGVIGQIHAAARPMVPGSGCLWCNGLVDPTELALDHLPREEARQARYLNEVPAPSVITLNALAVAEAVNHFMLAVTNLHRDDVDPASVLIRPRTRQRDLLNPRRDPACPFCGDYADGEDAS